MLSSNDGFAIIGVKGKMKKFLITLLASAAIITPALADDNIFHYSCKSDDSRYALTVNTDRGIIKLDQQAPPHTLTTFRILKEATDDVCAKYGWILKGATFCIATQGVGTLDWHGHVFNCDQADTE